MLRPRLPHSVVFRSIAFVLWGVLVAARAGAQDLGVAVDYVTDQIVLFDPQTATFLGAVPTGGSFPLGLTATPDGTTLLVSNVLSNTVSFFDLTTSPPTLLGSPVAIDSACQVLGTAVTPDGRFAVTSHLFCTPSDPSTVTCIDVSSREVISETAVTGTSVHDVAITRSGGVAIFNGLKNWTTLRLSPGGVLIGPPQDLPSPEQSAHTVIAVTPDGSLALVTDQGSRSVSVLTIDAADEVSHTGTVLEVGRLPGGLAIAPDGRRAYVVLHWEPAIAVLDVDDLGGEVTDTGLRIPLPHVSEPTLGSSVIAVSDDGRRAYVASESVVHVVDLEQLAYTGVDIVTTGQDLREVILVTTVLDVEVDIRPGSSENNVNPGSNGLLPVALLTSSDAGGPDVDATGIDPETVAFGPAGAAAVHSGHLRDLDGDGDLDLLLHFRIADTGLTCDDLEAGLTGATFAGRRIQGSDAISTVGCKRR